MGVYSRELMRALAAAGPDIGWKWLYRPHRYWRARSEPAPANVTRGLLLDRAMFRRPQLFHALNQRLPRQPFARQVVTFHDLFVMTAAYSSAEFRARFTAQAKHAAATADHIIAVSAFTARQVIDLLRVEAARVTVVPHGVRALPLPALAREKIVLHVGAIQKRKNLTRLVQAFARAPEDWRLVLAGSDGFGAAETYDAIAQSTAKSRIHVTGYLAERELAEWYARAMIFAFPSLDEGFGMPVLEAMAAGVPVISSHTSAVGEVAGDCAFSVDPTNTEAIAAALRSLAVDEALRERLIAAGRGRAAQFTWEAAAQATLAVYRAVDV